jgi:hypothetical protein
VVVGLEVASPKLIATDFDFRRYFLSVSRSQRIPGWGTMSVFGYVGSAGGAPPPQRQFTIDFGDPDNVWLNHPKTLDETNLAGDRAATIYVSHDFGSFIFQRLGLPVLPDLPISFLTYGGVFWSDFQQGTAGSQGDSHPAAVKAYSEIGFGIGRLPPGFLRLYFTWQLSDYPTEEFAVSFVLGI